MEAKFKTNIKCSGCVATVTPVLNELVGEENWKVDTQHPDKVLTITGETDLSEVRNAVEKAGYKAVSID
jgi:copper chaperone CopZ